MEISKTIRDKLAEEYRSGKTYQTMAAKRGVSFSYVRDLVLGKKPVERVSLDMLFRLFPHARIELEPGAGSVSGTATAGSGTAIVGHHIQATGGSRQLDAVLDKVMSSELDPASKVTVYQIIRQVREGSQTAVGK